MNRITLVVATLLLTCAPHLTAHAQDQPQPAWPAWRGADATGSTTKGDYATKWSATEHLAWKVELPGKGCSTPIVLGEQVIVTAPVERQDAVLAYDFKTGKPLWSTPVGEEKAGRHRNGSGSNPSPVTDGKHVFAYFKSGNLAGLDLKGNVIWKTNLQERFGKYDVYWDLGTSPVLTAKHVLVAVMHAGDSFVIALDKKTGDTAWKVARNYKTPVEGDHSYTTPHVVERDGKQIVLVWGAEHVTAHDAATGDQLWECGGFNPQKKGNWVAVGSAVVANDVIVVPYGRGSRLAGIKLGGKGDVTQTHRLWTREGIGCFVPTPAFYKGNVYIVRDRGEVVAVNPKTGQTVLEGNLPRHRASYYSSPTIAAGKLYMAREDGVVMVAQIEGGFEMISENDMGERIIASPVPVANRLLIRGEKHLFCVSPPEGVKASE